MKKYKKYKYNQLDKTKLKAVITVEASLVMPLIIIVIVSFMIISMYVHDVVVAKSLINTYLEKTALIVNKEYTTKDDSINYNKQINKNIILDNYEAVFNGDETKIKTVKKELENELEKRLLWCDVSSVHLSKNVLVLNCKIILDNRLGSSLFLSALSKKTQITENMDIVDECELIRFVDSLH